MKKNLRNWPLAMAGRLGLAGEIDYTRAAVGQTLHVPCAKGGHIVDVRIGSNQHPDRVAKHMLGIGWSMGSKLTCPDCQRKPSLRLVGKDENKAKGGRARAANMTPEQRSAVAKKAAEARWGKREQEQTMEQTAIESQPEQSDAAKRAHRLIFQALEDYYNESEKRYRPGYSDAKLATETGASESHVRKVREEFFGPLGEPSELTKLREEIKAARTEATTFMADHQRRITALESRMARICTANGWPQ